MLLVQRVDRFVDLGGRRILLPHVRGLRNDVRQGDRLPTAVRRDVELVDERLHRVAHGQFVLRLVFRHMQIADGLRGRAGCAVRVAGQCGRALGEHGLMLAGRLARRVDATVGASDVVDPTPALAGDDALRLLAVAAGVPHGHPPVERLAVVVGVRIIVLDLRIPPVRVERQRVGRECGRTSAAFDRIVGEVRHFGRVDARTVFGNAAEHLAGVLARPVLGA